MGKSYNHLTTAGVEEICSLSRLCKSFEMKEKSVMRCTTPGKKENVHKSNWEYDLVILSEP